MKDAGDVGVLHRGGDGGLASVGTLGSGSGCGSPTGFTPFPSVGLSMSSISSSPAASSGPFDVAESRVDGGGCGVQRPSLAVVKVLVVVSLLVDDRREL